VPYKGLKVEGIEKAADKKDVLWAERNRNMRNE
jgi:hypothetical protein